MTEQQPIHRIALNTGGGDAPGLNAVIESATMSAIRLGWEVFGIREGYSGILDPQNYADGGVMRLTPEKVTNISHLGGTILGTANRDTPFKVAESLPGGSTVERDRSSEVIDGFRDRGLDALISIGGDGTLTIANHMHALGLRVVGVPKTIDNDLAATQVTFGYHSAVSFATECIDRLHTTAESHGRIMVVEVMGRYAGWIALYAGIAGRADAILIPEIPYDIDHVQKHLQAKGERYSIVVVAEGAKAVGGGVSRIAGDSITGQERLGGVADQVAHGLGNRMGQDARTVVLGHLLRGGSPVAFDRVLGLGFGAAAVAALERGLNGVMVAFHPPHVDFVPLVDAVAKMRSVPLDGEGVGTARALDICTGDCWSD